MFYLVVYMFVSPIRLGALVIPQIFIEHELCAGLYATPDIRHYKYERYVSSLKEPIVW